MLRCCLRHCDRSSIGEVTWPYRTLEDIDSVPLGLLWSLWKVCLGWFSCWTMSLAIKPYSRQGFILKTAYEILSTCSLVYFAHISTSLRQPCSPKASVFCPQKVTTTAKFVWGTSTGLWRTGGGWLGEMRLILIGCGQMGVVLYWKRLNWPKGPAYLQGGQLWEWITDAFGLQGCLKEVDICAK